ncbi:C-type lectin domain family 4 member K-like [Monodelphis domestica]|uniref:C-type lectin domain family 4 member K-like n=1 Tax=Monodelphis domestica TaxID=13616 RepID=UPI0024E23E7A|nr:C-type lectin domain family 4 member K-like [Monodelphis domestica]
MANRKLIPTCRFVICAPVHLLYTPDLNVASCLYMTCVFGLLYAILTLTWTEQPWLGTHLTQVKIFNLLKKNLILFSLVFSSSSQESLSKIVSKNWKIYNGSLDYFSCDIKSWDEAEQFCVSQDSHLATVTSVGE